MQEINAQVEAGLAKARKAIDDRKLSKCETEKAHWKGRLMEKKHLAEVYSDTGSIPKLLYI